MDNKKALQMIGHRMIGVQARVVTPEDFARLDKLNAGLVGASWLTQSRADVEIARLEAARKDIMKGMSKADVKEYEVSVAADQAARVDRKDAQFGSLMKKKGK